MRRLLANRVCMKIGFFLTIILGIVALVAYIVIEKRIGQRYCPECGFGRARDFPVEQCPRCGALVK